MVKNLLIYTLLFPIFGIVLLLFTPAKKLKLMKLIALTSASLSFTTSLLVWGFFQNSVGSFQFVVKLFWFPNFNINFILGVDGISLFFLLLTTLLIPLCLLTSWNSVSTNVKEFLIAFLVLDFFLIGTFCVLDLLLFYIFFESVLIPMFLIIGIWGSRERKILASYYFFLYTLLGSVVMLLSILYIFSQVGTTDYETLLTFGFSDIEQKIMWLTFFIAFASKVPMLPVHLWLPEAHVEAPTAGSVILAGVLLKLGTYGFIRFSLPLFPKASFFFTPLVYTIAAVGIIYTSFTAIRQTDFKRIIAYTSIAHMNLVIIGIFSFNNIGLEGAILQSLSHGFVASALFLVIGVVYDRYRTRIVQYYGGLATVMPLYIAVFLFFTIANIAFPGTSSFVGEFLILVGSFKVNTTITFLGATGVIISGAYSLWLFNRIAFGNLKIQYTQTFLDLSFRESILFLPLILGTFIIGIYPNIFLSSIHMSVNYLVELLYF
jgi:proton-translocating NADH-quinone oxidoreductase chain M|uniref:NADH-ubiquinone oxidoreductase chain 4 n=1 Tax=Fistulifera solaris TaxID=1519565 RepID=A0A0U2L2A5_FISSO|nr:NADH dehydrogenase subunit 4 [Fistulifera solaris]ALG35792.1 NADH dehydrogenase subunit 4 [Fistulifera solaris]